MADSWQKAMVGEVAADCRDPGPGSWRSRTWESLCVALIVLLWLLLPTVIFVLIPLLALLALLRPDLWWFLCPLLAWTYYDWDAGRTGGRKLFHLHGTAFARGITGYYPLRVVRAPGCVLDPTKNYIIDAHPHGVIQLATFGITELSDQVTAAFPGITFIPSITETLLHIPIVREYIMGFGAVANSEAGLRYVLQHPGRGVALLVMSGGTAETLRLRPDSVHLYLRRKGFCRVALLEGAPLIPTLIFGKNESYRQPLIGLQDWMYRTFGWRVIIPIGIGMFQKYLGFLPLRVPHTYVLGAPIPVQKVANPTQAEVDELHSKHVEALRQLYEQYAPLLQPQKLPLIIEQ